MTSAPQVAPPRVEKDAEREPRHAPLYKVLLHNDDVTPFLFVQHEICEGIFHLSAGQAYRVTSEVHNTGIGLAGVYPLEHAELKCEQVRSLARGRGYPLRVSYEPA